MIDCNKEGDECVDILSMAKKDADDGGSCLEDSEGVGDVHESIPARSSVGADDVVNEQSSKWPNKYQTSVGNEVLLGADAVALYPSLDPVTCQQIEKEVVSRSQLKMRDINYLEATRYISLCLNSEEAKSHPLKHVLPIRRNKNGQRPHITTNENVRSSEANNTDQWIWPNVILSPNIRRQIMAEVMGIAVEVFFSTHVYTFGGHCYLQTQGGPIGPRATCAIARVVCNHFDAKLKKLMQDSKISHDLFMRYVDDIR